MPQSHQTPQQLLLPVKKYTLKKEKTLKTSIPPDTQTASPPSKIINSQKRINSQNLNPTRHPNSFSSRSSFAASASAAIFACRPHKCQKRPTRGAKETYYMRTFESLPAQPAPPTSLSSHSHPPPPSPLWTPFPPHLLPTPPLPRRTAAPRLHCPFHRGSLGENNGASDAGGYALRAHPKPMY